MLRNIFGITMCNGNTSPKCPAVRKVSGRKVWNRSKKMLRVFLHYEYQQMLYYFCIYRYSIFLVDTMILLRSRTWTSYRTCSSTVWGEYQYHSLNESRIIEEVQLTNLLEINYIEEVLLHNKKKSSRTLLWEVIRIKLDKEMIRNIDKGKSFPTR